MFVGGEKGDEQLAESGVTEEWRVSGRRCICAGPLAVFSKFRFGSAKFYAAGRGRRNDCSVHRRVRTCSTHAHTRAGEETRTCMQRHATEGHQTRTRTQTIITLRRHTDRHEHIPKHAHKQLRMHTAGASARALYRSKSQRELACTFVFTVTFTDMHAYSDSHLFTFKHSCNCSCVEIFYEVDAVAFLYGCVSV